MGAEGKNSWNPATLLKSIIAIVALLSIAASMLKATGMGINMPSICLLLAINAPFAMP